MHAISYIINSPAGQFSRLSPLDCLLKKKLSEIIRHRDVVFYEMKSAHGLPTRFDRIVLIFLLQKLLQNEVHNYSLIITRYEIAKNVYDHIKSFSKQKYDRIMLALKRWESMSIQFEQLMRENIQNNTTYYSIIDSVNLDPETHKLIIRFNQYYVDQIQNFTVFKETDAKTHKRIFSEYKKLARPIAVRLYEILMRHLFNQYLWCIDIHDLKILLTVDAHYSPSRVLQLLHPAIEEVNTYTFFNVDFDYDKQRSLCIFKRKD